MKKIFVVFLVLLMIGAASIGAADISGGCVSQDTVPVTAEVFPAMAASLDLIMEPAVKELWEPAGEISPFINDFILEGPNDPREVIPAAGYSKPEVWKMIT
jgi:hypothetical protein